MRLDNMNTDRDGCRCAERVKNQEKGLSETGVVAGAMRPLLDITEREGKSFADRVRTYRAKD